MCIRDSAIGGRGGACSLLIGQEILRRVSTASEWILTLDLVVLFLTFLREFTRIDFDAPALKGTAAPSDALNSVHV